MAKHRGTYARRYRALAEAAKKNKANRHRRDKLLAELAFNDELWKTYSAGSNFSCPAMNPVVRHLLDNDDPLYYRLLGVWLNK